MSAGILVSQSLKAMVESGAIRLGQPAAEGQIQPSSVDLRIGARLWQLQCSFLPGSEGIEAKLNRLATAEYRFQDDEPVVLHQGGVYLAELEEGLALPPEVWGRGNPKSSTGRLDVFVRLLTVHGEAFDTVPPGYEGPLFLEITPQSFHVKIRRGDTLGQLRLARGRPGLSAQDLDKWQQNNPLCTWSDGSPAPVIDGAPPGVLLQVDLLAEGQGPVGYMARRHQPAVDLRDRGLSIQQYWTPLSEHDGGQVLEPEQFYIFATRERLRIPPELCAELVAFDATKGELRTHYAGFIDSGFGWSEDGSVDGARLVLEIRTHDLPFLLEHGQALFRVEFMANESVPDSLYGQTSNNYQGQGLRLAKQFGSR